jgi:hypothetical protein
VTNALVLYQTERARARRIMIEPSEIRRLIEKGRK